VGGHRGQVFATAHHPPTRFVLRRLQWLDKFMSGGDPFVFHAQTSNVYGASVALDETKGWESVVNLSEA